MPIEANPRNWEEVPEEMSISNDEQIFIVKKVGTPPEGRFRRIKMDKVTAQFEAQLQAMVDLKFAAVEALVAPQEGTVTPVSATSGVSLTGPNNEIQWHRILNRCFITVNITPSLPNGTFAFMVSGLPFKPKRTETWFGFSGNSSLRSIQVIITTSGTIQFINNALEAFPPAVGGLTFSGSYQIDE